MRHRRKQLLCVLVIQITCGNAASILPCCVRYHFDMTEYVLYECGFKIIIKRVIWTNLYTSRKKLLILIIYMCWFFLRLLQLYCPQISVDTNPYRESWGSYNYWKRLESTHGTQSIYLGTRCEANWGTVWPKSFLKPVPYLVDRMRRVSLICAEGKYCLPILGISFPQVVCREQYLCSHGELLWLNSLNTHSEGERHRALVSVPTFCLHPLEV